MIPCPLTHESCIIHPSGVLEESCLQCPSAIRLIRDTGLEDFWANDYRDSIRKGIEAELTTEPGVLDILLPCLESRARDVEEGLIRGKGSPFLLRCYRRIIKDIEEEPR